MKHYRLIKIILFILFIIPVTGYSGEWAIMANGTPNTIPGISGNSAKDGDTLKGEDIKAISSEQPYIKEYSNSGCLSNYNVDSSEYSEEYPYCEDEGIKAKVEGDSIFLTHSNATYNCCPDDIKVTLFVKGNRLILREKEILTTPCECLCCYNIETQIAGVKPDTYILIVCWEDYEKYRKVCDRVKVVVPPGNYGSTGLEPVTY